MKKPLISVIIPVYNTYALLERCLDSLINQTYPNLQIICVDDCSPDRSSEILEKYKDADHRVEIVHNERNMGLFHARMEGLKVAKGDYIAFLDSDDYISSDYYRCMLENAIESNSDIVFSKIIHEDSSGKRYIHNIYHFMDLNDLYGKTPFEAFLNQEGRCFIWHTVWNKLYKKELWDKALPFLMNQKKHLIMTEDFVFSSIIFFFAKKISSVDYAFHFYYQHPGASTSANGNFKKYQKNISDLVIAFNFVESFFIEQNLNNELMAKYFSWKSLYSRFWYDNIVNAPLELHEKKELYRVLEDGLQIKELKPTVPSDHYFYSISTDWDSRYYDLQEYLISSNKEYYSFDIFDTAILRPFTQPKDLFLLLEKDFHELF